GRDNDDFQLVDLVELSRFRLRRTGHAGQFFVHAEVILEGDGCQRLVLALDLHAFLGFDRLVQSIRPAAAWHQTASELIHDEHFAVFHHVLDITPVERVGFDGGVNVMLQVPVLRVGDIADAQQALHFLPANVCDGDGAMLLVHYIVAGENLVFTRARIDLFAQLQLRNDAVDAVILVRRFLTGTADDERGTRFIDEDRVHFVHDGIVVAALHAVAQVELHVVAQVVEAELVVGAVGNVRAVGFAPLVVVEVVHDDANRQAEEGVELAHPLRIALGEIVIYGDDVNAAPGERVEIHRQRGNQRFAFTGLHLGDFALMQHDAADELHVEVPHLQDAPAGLAHHREGFRQNFV